MKGKWHAVTASIIDESNGMVVAEIKRDLGGVGLGREAIFNKQTYEVKVAPGVDMALMAAMCICLDEKTDKKPSPVQTVFKALV
jgi:uncharacterized protein YxjI